MTPYEQAARVYQTEPCARTFTEDVEAHLMNGFVFSTPAYFLMFRPVVRSAPEALILDPTHRFSRILCDTWMVWLFAGDMAAAWERQPFPLPWVAYQRKNELRFLPLGAIKRLSLLTPP